MSDGIDPAMAELEIGAKVADYRLDEQIGRGGMAVVYRALDERLDRRVALKILAPELARDTAFRMRFIRESRAAAAVDHPNIIPIYDAGNAVGVLYIAMRYVQGGDVRSLLERLGPLPAAQACSVIAQVASALDTAHAHGLIHRDVKPANMLLDSGGGTAQPTSHPVPGEHPEHVYLSDFGISKQSLSKGFTSTGQFVGTLDYVAPEQIEGHGIDGRTDQYSLACAAFELLCGTPPFQRDQGLALLYAQLSEPPPSLTGRRGDLPADVDRVLARALAKKPAERYATCMEFAMELSTALGVSPAEPEAGPPRQPRPGPATELAGPVSQPEPQPLPAADRTPGGQGGAGPVLPGVPTAFPGGAGMPTGPGGQGGQGWQAGPGGQGGQGWQAGPGGQGGQGGQGWQAGPGGQDWQGGQAGQASPGWQGGPGGQAGPGPGGQAGPGWQAGPGPGWQGGPGGQAGPGWQGGQGWQGGTGGQAGPGSPGWQGGGQGGPGQQGWTWPAGPTGPGWPQQAPRQAPRRRSGAVLAVVAIAVVVLIAVAVPTIIGLRKQSSPPTQGASPPVTSPASSPLSPLASGQAASVNTLLDASASTHRLLLNGINDLETCSDPAGGVTLLQEAVSQRRSEVSRASALQTSALANGATLQSDLHTALGYSLRSDQANLTWGRQVTNTACTGQLAPENASDVQATSYKTMFLQLWNPLAPQYGFQARAESSF